MKKKPFHRFVKAAACLSVLCLSTTAMAQRQMEQLSRGVIAVPNENGSVFVSWRLLATEPQDSAFNVYRAGADGNATKLNAQPLTKGTCFVDEKANIAQGATYTVRPVVNGRELEAGKPYKLPPNAKPYLSIPIQTPAGYTPNDCSAADLDGDGEFDIVVHMTGNGKDNSQAGVTDPPVLQGYKTDGTLLWSVNLGKNVREGAHYTQFMVYDFDGNGHAEMMVKTADGATDSKGKVIGDAKADWRNERGYILRGPEYISVFDGKTGEVLASADYAPGRYPGKDDPTTEELKAFWGDGYGNRMDRFLAGVAYVDGVRPTAIFSRGYYTRTFIAAWDWRDGKLTRRWLFDSESPENLAHAGKATADNKYPKIYSGQGYHSLSIADVDADGKDEIIFGSMTVNGDGTGRYSTGWSHGDALHVGDLDPTRPGLEIYGIQERFADAGVHMHDANTGEPLWKKASVAAGADGEGPGRGVSFNIDPRYPGNECWSAGANINGLWDAKGNEIGKIKPDSCNFRIYWDGDLLDELLDTRRPDAGETTNMVGPPPRVPCISKWNWETQKTEPLLFGENCSTNNGTKATPALSGDLMGDWREEVIWRSEDGKELRLYSTNILTEHRIYTLMQDPQYRLAIAWQNTAYNQPPHPSFHIGPDMTAPPLPKIKVVPAPLANAR